MTATWSATDSDTADLLRQAAALMRERAEACLGGRWVVDPASHDFDPHGGPHVRYVAPEGNYSCSIAYGVWPENAARRRARRGGLAGRRR